MPDYKHGTYGDIVSSIGGNAAKGSTIPVYVGVAPCHLVHNGYKYCNTPILLYSMDDVYRYFGYCDNWMVYDLCGAFYAHFKNPMGNVGPIVAVNVASAVTRGEIVTGEYPVNNGMVTIYAHDIFINDLTVADMVKGTDYTVNYDFDRGCAVIMFTGDVESNTVTISYPPVTHPISNSDVIGSVDVETGTYTGLGCVSQIYPKFGLIPNIIVCPMWGADPDVYKAMVKAATKINGHWDAIVYADIPAFAPDGTANNDTIAKAIAWKKSNGYTDERSKVFWPQATTLDGKPITLSLLAAWATLATDAANDGVPMESVSNKAILVSGQYFGPNATNGGFDVQSANKLNAAGITTAVFWGGKWVLWGPHTAAYEYGKENDNRVIFDTSMRMLFHVSNSFQKDWAVSIDKPMTRALADTIKAREQEKMDAWARMGAFIGEPVVEFRESANGSGDILEGNFTWHSKGTPTPPFKSGTLKVAYTSEGFDSFFGEVQ